MLHNHCAFLRQPNPGHRQAGSHGNHNTEEQDGLQKIKGNKVPECQDTPDKSPLYGHGDRNGCQGGNQGDQSAREKRCYGDRTDIVVIGGGGNCFSFGTHLNNSPLLLSL